MYVKNNIYNTVWRQVTSLYAPSWRFTSFFYVHSFLQLHLILDHRILTATLNRFIQLHHLSEVWHKPEANSILHSPVMTEYVGSGGHSSSYEPGVAEVLDENLVDEGVLSQGLNHQHSLSTQLQQVLWDIQRLKQTNY